MGNNRPLSFTTRLGKIGEASRKLASHSLVQGLWRSIPGLLIAALAGVVITFFAWSGQAQGQQLAREAEGLRQSPESLRKQEVARADEVATLPTSEVVSRVASRLEEQGTGNREQGTGQEEQVSGVRFQVSGQEEQVSGVRFQVSGQEEQVSGVRFQVSGQQEPGSGVRDRGSWPAANASSASGPALVLSDQGVRKVGTAFAVEYFAGGFIAGVVVR
jgi:hypothetical protein